VDGKKPRQIMWVCRSYKSMQVFLWRLAGVWWRYM